QSQASLQMKVPNVQSQTSPHIIELNQMIHHGPLLFSRLGRHLDININPAIIYTSLAGELGKKTHALWNHQEPALITTLINWKTKATTKVKTQPLAQTIHDKFIELSKTEIQISHDLN